MSKNRQYRMIRLPKTALSQRKKWYVKVTPTNTRYAAADKYKSWRDKNVAIKNAN